jgi:hypothetical protein
MILGATPAGGQEYSVRIDAKSAILLDAFSNQVIFEQNPRERDQVAQEKYIRHFHILREKIRTIDGRRRSRMKQAFE